MKALKLFKRILGNKTEGCEGEPAAPQNPSVAGEILPQKQERRTAKSCAESVTDEREEENEKSSATEAASIVCVKKSAGSAPPKSLKEMLMMKGRSSMSRGEGAGGGKTLTLKHLISELDCLKSCSNFMSRLKPNVLLRNPFIVPKKEEYMALMEARFNNDHTSLTVEDIRRRARKIIANKRKKSGMILPSAFASACDRNRAQPHKVSRMKELVKWHPNGCKGALNTKPQPLPKSKGSNNTKNKKKKDNEKELRRSRSSSEDDTMSSSSSSRLNRWDVKNSSSSSFSSSASSSSCSSFGRIPAQSKWELPLQLPLASSSSSSSDFPGRCYAERDFWITTDSEYVVLEM